MKSDPKKLTLPCWMFSLLSKPYLMRDWLSHLIEAYRGMWGILFETIGNGCSMDMAMEFGEEVVARKRWWRLWCMADGIGQQRWRAFDDGSCVQWWRRHSMTAAMAKCKTKKRWRGQRGRCSGWRQLAAAGGGCQWRSTAATGGYGNRRQQQWQWQRHLMQQWWKAATWWRRPAREEKEGAAAAGKCESYPCPAILSA